MSLSRRRFLETTVLSTLLSSIYGTSAGAATGRLQLSARMNRVIGLAAHHARMLGHEKIGSEHLLLALASEAEESDADWLDASGATARDLRDLTACMLGEYAPEDIPQHEFRWSSNANAVFALAQTEAELLGHKVLQPEHVLLGLTEMPDCTASEILHEMWMETAVLRQLAIETLGRIG